MANRYRNLIYSTAEYTKVYNGFRGVELNGSSSVTSSNRLAYAENVYKDYEGDGADVIESIPGYRCFAHYEEPVHSMFYMHSASGGEDCIVAHVGSKLIRHPLSDIFEEFMDGEVIGTAEDTKSFGFQHGGYLYILDTKMIYRVSEDGEVNMVGTSGIYPYVPTTYVSGEEYEQRNLLVNDFTEEYYLADPKAYLYASEGVKYGIVNSELRLCTVRGIHEGVSGEIYVPAYVNISGVSYKVVSVSDYAFKDNTDIHAIYLPDGVTSIGKYAFSDCTSLRVAVTPSTITHIGEKAFSGCTELHSLYLGSGLTSVGEAFISDCDSLLGINYELNDEDIDMIEGSDLIRKKEIFCQSTYDLLYIYLPLHGEVEGIEGVTVNDEDGDYELHHNGSFFDGVMLTFPSLADATDVKIEIKANYAPLGSKWSEEMSALEVTSPYQAIACCTIAEVFDGRIFLSGNPSFPNTVFYTERPKKGHEEELYVGAYNYFNDGNGKYKVKSLLAVRDMLAVFKEGDDGAGSIFYHKKEATDIGAIDTVYPVAYIHSGICSSGESFSFLDDPVFLTNDGLMALDHQNINYQRNIVCRSHNVNYGLLKEDLSRASLCEWLGYLVIGVNGKVFLADSRAVFTHPTGSREYEWFLLDGIGGYADDNGIFKYSADARPGYPAHPTRVGEIADPYKIYGAMDSNNQVVFYTPENGVKYILEETPERNGGDFYPATTFISYGKRLFFATDYGHLCVFNNDMRGVPPPRLAKSDEYDEEEYKALMGNKIHPYYYGFQFHAPKYVIKTSLDDCGIPHLTKNTVRKSLVIKAKSYIPEAISCEVVTDGTDETYIGNFPYSETGFDEFDFSSMPWSVSRYTATALSEKEKRWIEKQVILSSEKYGSPLSVYSISYRYTIKGKIKNNV